MGHPHGGPRASSRRRTLRLTLALLVLVGSTAAIVAAASATTGSKTATIKVGLITKDVTNPFFVKMKQGATAQARKLGAQLKYAAGKSSSDNAGQIAAIENMTTQGVKGICLLYTSDAADE